MTSKWMAEGTNSSSLSRNKENCNNVFGVSRSHRWCVSRCCTCKVYVGSRGAFSILYTFFSITEHHPAAVLPRISSRGRRQNQLTVPLMLLDAGTTQASLSWAMLTNTVSYYLHTTYTECVNLESFYKLYIFFWQFSSEKYFIHKGEHICCLKNHFGLLEIALMSLKWHVLQCPLLKRAG